MDVLDQIFGKKKQKIPRQTQPTQKNEYSDLTDMKQMLAYTHRRQGLGFEEEVQQQGEDNPKKGFVKPLSKKQIIDPEKKEEKEQTTQNKKKVIEEVNSKTIISKKKIHKIVMNKGKKVKEFNII